MRRFIISCVLVCSILPLRNNVYCQDLLYRKDSTVVKVKILDFNGKTITYKAPGDSSGRTFFLNKVLLDSLRYENGNTYKFNTPNVDEIPKKLIARNYLRTDAVNLLYGLINLDYERISKNGKTGFEIECLGNVSGKKDYAYWDGDHYLFRYGTFRPFYFFIRSGFDFYPFNYSLLKSSNTRTSTGLFLIAGSVRKRDYDYYSDTGDITSPAFEAIVTWDVRERFYLSDNFQVSAGIEVSVVPFMTFFSPQMSFSLGF